MDESKTPPTHFGIVPLSRFVPRGFGFVHHSIAILYHEVPNPYSHDSQLFHRCKVAAARATLPIAQFKQQILDAVASAQVGATATRRSGVACRFGGRIVKKLRIGAEGFGDESCGRFATPSFCCVVAHVHRATRRVVHGPFYVAPLSTIV